MKKLLLSAICLSMLSLPALASGVFTDNSDDTTQSTAQTRPLPPNLEQVDVNQSQQKYSPAPPSEGRYRGSHGNGQCSVPSPQNDSSSTDGFEKF